MPVALIVEPDVARRSAVADALRTARMDVLEAESLDELPNLASAIRLNVIVTPHTAVWRMTLDAGGARNAGLVIYGPDEPVWSIVRRTCHPIDRMSATPPVQQDSVNATPEQQ